MHLNMMYKSPSGNSLNVRERDKTPIATVVVVDDVVVVVDDVDAFCSWDVQSFLTLNIC